MNRVLARWSGPLLPTVLLTAMLAGIGLLRLWLGPLGPGWPENLILTERAWRLLIGALVGIALGLSGVALQVLVRNVLAEPFLLGLSSGAGLGVMAQLLLASWLTGLVAGTELGAFLGAMLAMGLVFLLGRRQGVLDPLGLLLTGVVIATIAGSLIMLMNHLAGPGGVRSDLARWMMGYLSEGLDSRVLLLAGGATLIGGLMLLSQGRAMDLAILSEEEARSLGVSLGRLRLLLFLAASLMTAASVVLAGPIAFVGLIAPHLGRLLLGPSHRPLLLASALLGACLVVAADTLSDLIGWFWGIGAIPIGVLTALLGGPAFLWMLRPKLGQSSEL